MIINLLNNTKSNYINIILIQPNIIFIDNISHIITINQTRSSVSSPIYQSELTISDTNVPTLKITI